MLADVLGQDDAVVMLRRIVDGSYLSPLLLVGDEGVGRRFSVLQVAREMFCRSLRTNECRCIDCVQLLQGSHPDFLTVASVDDKDIGVDAIRDVLATTQTHPTMAPVRIIFVDGVDRMTAPAANAILKTLEEPPTTVRFFLSTESVDRVLPTIHSRCGRVPFRNLPESFIVSRLSKFDDDGTKSLVYARIAEGSVGRAVRFWTSNRLKLRDHVLGVIEHGLKGDVSSMFATIDEIGADLPLSLRFFEHALHDLLISHVDPSRMVNVDVSEQIMAMRASASDHVWIRMRSELKLVYQRYQSTHINLPFHVKAALVNSFSA